MRSRVFLFVATVLLAASSLAAQSTTGSISGVAIDESKAILPGVTVTVTNQATEVSRTSVTDERGRYRALNLQPGIYAVAADLAGFQPLTFKDIEVTIGNNVTLELLLKLGGVQEQVTVEGEVQQLDLKATTVGGVVSTKQIAELPLNGRSFMQLATLQPGVIVSRSTARDFTGGYGSTQVAVAGARPEMTGYLLEGTNIADISDKAPSSMAGVMLGVDTVQEFSVQTHGYSAEFGRAAGGIISAVTKSGTNQLRGSAFEFHRDSAWDAPNYFDVGDEPPPFKRNQFGATLGGPVLKNRLFFFASYEGLRQQLATTQVARLPNALAHQGIIPVNGVLTNVGVNPLVRPYLDLLYPIPDGRDFGDGTAEFRHAETDPTTENFYVGKLDWQASQQDSFIVRLSVDPSETQASQAHPLFRESQTTNTRYFTGQHQRVFSSSVLNQVRFAINRTRRSDTVSPTVDIPANLFFTADKHPETGEPYWGVLNVTGMSAAGSTATLPVLYVQNLYQLSDTFTWNRGKQTMKFGGEWQRYHFDGYSNSRFGGEFRFRNLQEFLTLRRSATAAADRFTGNMPNSDTDRNMRQNYFAFFAQDDYDVKDNLSLNVGLRYEFVTTPYDLNGKVAGLLSLDDLESGPKGVTPGSPFFDNPSPSHGLAPRVGVSWRPGSEKNVVKAGYGIFYQPLTTSFYRGTSFRIFPYFAGVDIRTPAVFGAGIQTLLNQGTGLAVQKRSEFIYYDTNQPYSQHIYVNYQRELGGYTAEVGLLGSTGSNLPFYGDPNSVPAEQMPDGRWRVVPGEGLRYPSWGRIRTRINVAESWYNGMTLSLNRRFAKGLMFQGSYTLGKSMDTWSGGQIGGNDYDTGAGSATNWWCPSCEKGRSNYDVRHNFVFNAVYVLPFGQNLTGMAGAVGKGWQVGGILNLASGVPFTVFAGFDRAGDLQSDSEMQKPDLAAGASSNPILGDPNQWFDPSSFLLPQAGYYGNLGRNTLEGPGLATVDFSVFKNTKIGPTNFQIRLEMFNMLNRANFAPPSEVMLFNPNGSRRQGVGQITRTSTTARQIQLGAKITF